MAHPRYLPSIDPSTSPRISNPHEQLILTLTKVLRGCPPSNPWTDKFKQKPMGLWTGPTSIAYLFLWLADTHPDLTVEGASPRQWCFRYLDCGSSELPGPHGLNDWGIKNEYLAYNVVQAAVSGSESCVRKVVDAICTSFDCPPADNEHLSGRAGTLALLRIIRRWQPQYTQAIESCIEKLIDQIMAARPWTFHGHRYIGAAHGMIGIITEIILSKPSMGHDPSITAIIGELLDLQTEGGHWYITDDPTLGSPDLVHYCHGSPGFVISLSSIRPHVSDYLQQRIDTATEKGRREVWEKGLLTKEPNLCHGIVGNMLALPTWELREHFMEYATEASVQQCIADGKFVAGDDPHGLLWGAAGRAWGWMMLDTKRDLGYPSYNDV